MAETQAELQRTREDLRSRDQEMSELMSRVRDLEELNSKNARLIELKDAEVAELQRRLAEAASAAAAAPAPAPEPGTAPGTAAEIPLAEPETPAMAQVEPAPVADAITSADAEPAVDADPLGAQAIDPLLADEAAGGPAALADPASDGTTDPALAGEPVSEDDWAASATGSSADPFAPEAAGAPPPPADALAESAPAPLATTAQDGTGSTPAATPWYLQPMVQGAALIGLALLLLLALLARRQRRNALADETPRRSVSDLFGSTGVAAAGAEDGADGEEARALQARIQADPDDRGAYLELLSLYYAEGDRDRFEVWAERMFEQPGAEDSEEWDQVFGMGEELLPDHPLFADDGEGDEDDVAGLDADDGYRHPDADPLPDADAPLPPPRVVDIGGTELRLDSETDDDYDLGDDMPIEFERTSPEGPVTRPPAGAQAGERDEADHADALPPLVFADDDDYAPRTPAAAGQGSADGDDGGLDDAATKLELARAYLDMGDPDGARAMLEEVLGEGDTSQREEARKLLATL